MGGMRELVRRFRKVDHRDLLVRSASLCINDSQESVRKEFVMLSQSVIPLIFGDGRISSSVEDGGDGNDGSTTAWRRLLMLSIQSGLNSLCCAIQLASFQVIEALIAVVRNTELRWKEVFRGWDSYLWAPIVRILKNPRSSIHVIAKSVQLLATCLDNLHLDSHDHDQTSTLAQSVSVGERCEREMRDKRDTVFGIMSKRRQKHMKLSSNGEASSFLWSDERLSVMEYTPSRSCVRHMDIESEDYEEVAVSGTAGSLSIRESLSIEEALIELMDDLWGTWIQMTSSSGSNPMEVGSKRTPSGSESVQDEGDYVSPLKILCYMIDMIHRKDHREQFKKNVTDHLLPRFPFSEVHQRSTKSSRDPGVSARRCISVCALCAPSSDPHVSSCICLCRHCLIWMKKKARKLTSS